KGFRRQVRRSKRCSFSARDGNQCQSISRAKPRGGFSSAPQAWSMYRGRACGVFGILDRLGDRNNIGMASYWTMAMRDVNYDEQKELDAYISRNTWGLFTDFERRCIRLGTIRENAEGGRNEPLAQKIWDREADEEVKGALANGVTEFRKRVTDRVYRDCQVS